MIYRGRCQFCRNEAVTRCEWPVEGWRLVAYSDLKVGDRVRRAIDRTGRPPAEVLFTGPWFDNHLAVNPAALQIVLRIRNSQKEILVQPTSSVQVAASVPCGNACCENHLRCVEPGVEYCQDHWHSWEQVA